jgi:hypothetical protein
MPRHTRPDIHRPVQDNVKHHAEPAKHSKKNMDVPNEKAPSKSPQATSLPGQLTIIKDVGQRSGGIHGIPGIISSTTTSPETRRRLVSGIIEHLMRGAVAPAGPVSTVQGHDATAYSAGMAHMTGSSFKGSR